MSARAISPALGERQLAQRPAKLHRQRRVEATWTTAFTAGQVHPSAATLPLPVLAPNPAPHFADYLELWNARARDWLSPVLEASQQGLAAVRDALFGRPGWGLWGEYPPRGPGALEAQGRRSSGGWTPAAESDPFYDPANPYARARASASERPSPAQQALAKNANNALGMRLLEALWRSPSRGSSVALSPFSLACTLSLLAGGAEPRQRAAFATAFLLASDGELDEVGRAWRQASDASKQMRHVSALFVGCRAAIRPGFARHLRGAGVGVFAAENTKQASCRAMNDWVKMTSYGRIGDIVGAQDLEDDNATLLDAVVFDGRWQQAFLGENTRERTDFWPHGASGSPRSLPMMFQRQRNFYSLVTAQFDAVVLPYRSEAQPAPSALFVALPKAEREVHELLQTFVGHGLPSTGLFAQRTFAQLGLPRWTEQSALTLSPSLCELQSVDIKK